MFVQSGKPLFVQTKRYVATFLPASGIVPTGSVLLQVLQAKSAAATSVERDAVIHSQLHHPNVIGFKKVQTHGFPHACVSMPAVNQNCLGTTTESQ